MGTIWGGCMNKIVKFDSEQAVNAYCKKKAIRELGTGSEGTCYLGRDGIAYKDMSEGYRSEQYIPEDIIKEIWFPYKKGKVERGNSKGTGLGLAISRTILELHKFSYGI